LALMTWLAVLPTLTILNLALGSWLSTLTPAARTFVLATLAVPIVIYGLMPQMHRLRARFLNRVVRTWQLRPASAGNSPKATTPRGDPT
jgi:antibiotic biosynthesis monooxygenase (ABM) superfamily enzyme